MDKNYEKLTLASMPDFTSKINAEIQRVARDVLCRSDIESERKVTVTISIKPFVVGGEVCTDIGFTIKMSIPSTKGEIGVGKFYDSLLVIKKPDDQQQSFFCPDEPRVSEEISAECAADESNNDQFVVDRRKWNAIA